MFLNKEHRRNGMDTTGDEGDSSCFHIWQTREDFQRQCGHFQVDRWSRNFLADTHDLNMDRLARQSGFHAAVELKMMAIALLQRDRAVAGLAAAGLAAAGRKRRARSTTIVGEES
jgi:hypothetical protein